MSRVLAELMGEDPDRLGRMISKLESNIDRESIDTRLIGDIYEASARVHRLYGLDPRDTTPYELYVVLRSRAHEDNERLARLLGGQFPNAVSEMTPHIVTHMQAHVRGTICWSLKSSVAKKLLQKNPPRHLQQALRYRSLASMLKHEPSSQLMVAARYVEDDAWNREMIEQYRGLTPQDFEQRPFEISYLDNPAYCDILAPSSRRHHFVLHSKEMGAIMIAPTREKVIRGYTLRTVSLILHSIHEIISMSSLMKYHQVDTAFGARIASAIANDDVGHVQLAGRRVHWRSLHRFFGSVDDPDSNVEHMDGADWRSQKVNDGVAQFAESLGVWDGSEWVAKPGQQPVSYNLVDVSIDASYEAPFDTRSLKYMRRNLESELLSRYLAIPHVRNLALLRITSDNR